MSGTSFQDTFSTYSFHKNISLIFLQMTQFQYQTYFPSQDVKQNVFQILVYPIHDIIVLRLTLIIFQAVSDRKKKKGRGR